MSTFFHPNTQTTDDPPLITPNIDKIHFPDPYNDQPEWPSKSIVYCFNFPIKQHPKTIFPEKPPPAATGKNTTKTAKAKYY